MFHYSSAFPKRADRGGYTDLDGHRHAGSYFVLVLTGGNEEAGNRGCLSVVAVSCECDWRQTAFSCARMAASPSADRACS